MRLAFVGAQGTGKTTVLEQFEDKGYKIITEVVRNLSKEGVNINKMGDSESQIRIFKAYEQLLCQDNLISDRGLVDVMAYTFYLHEQGRVDDITLNFIMQRFQNFIENVDLTYVYFPIYFPVVDDGVRSVDEKFRAEIDKYVLWILDHYELHYVTIPNAPVEDRTQFIQNLIESLCN